MDGYVKEGTKFQILVPNTSLCYIIEDWYERNEACDLRLRKAKTSKCTVIETEGILFAGRIVEWYHPVKVNIVEPAAKPQGTVAGRENVATPRPEARR